MKIKPIEDWRRILKCAGSIRLAAVFSILSFVVTSNPIIIATVLSILPRGPLLYALAAGVAVLAFAVPAATRLLKLVRGGDDAPDA